jgi:hypothetical protein
MVLLDVQTEPSYPRQEDLCSGESSTNVTETVPSAHTQSKEEGQDASYRAQILG